MERGKSDEVMDSNLGCVFEMPNANDKLDAMEPSKVVLLNASNQDAKPHRVPLSDTETGNSQRV